jgi:hypothetical protein
MPNRLSPRTEPDRELRWFVDDYCGCAPADTADPVSAACADAALMLAQQTSD